MEQCDTGKRALKELTTDVCRFVGDFRSGRNQVEHFESVPTSFDESSLSRLA